MTLVPVIECRSFNLQPRCEICARFIYMADCAALPCLLYILEEKELLAKCLGQVTWAARIPLSLQSCETHRLYCDTLAVT